jgi:hypothetical protein
MPRAVYGDPNQNNRISDRFVENGSYLRLKTISLSYNFPKEWLKVLTIENARLTLSCENVATSLAILVSTQRLTSTASISPVILFPERSTLA